MFQSVVTILTAIGIAFVSSFITFQLSLIRFRSERLWERKVTAYENVIAALHDSKAFTGNHIEADYEDSEITGERDKELRVRSNSAHEEIAKAIDVGTFLLSEEAITRLKSYQEEIEKAKSPEGSWLKHLEADLSATDNCLKDLITIAKLDLKAKWL